VDIRWPDGTKETYKLPGVDRYYAIEEGKGLVPSVYDHIFGAQPLQRAATATDSKASQ